MKRKTLTKDELWMPGVNQWKDYKKFKPEEFELCIVEFKEYIETHDDCCENYIYKVMEFDEDSWWMARRWKYLYE